MGWYTEHITRKCEAEIAEESLDKKAALRKLLTAALYAESYLHSLSREGIALNPTLLATLQSAIDTACEDLNITTKGEMK